MLGNVQPPEVALDERGDSFHVYVSVVARRLPDVPCHRQRGPDTASARPRRAELNLDAALTADDLVSSDDVSFVMTGITDGELLHGVRYGRDRAQTDSLVMQARSGTVRQVRSNYRLDRLGRYRTMDYRHA